MQRTRQVIFYLFFKSCILQKRLQYLVCYMFACLMFVSGVGIFLDLFCEITLLQ